MPNSTPKPAFAKAPILPRPKILLPPSYWIEREEEPREHAVTRAASASTQVLSPGFLMGLLAVLVLVNLMLVTIFKGSETPMYAPAAQARVMPTVQAPSPEPATRIQSVETPYAAPIQMEAVAPTSAGLIPAPETRNLPAQP